jgi:hypothetical protein
VENDGVYIRVFIGRLSWFCSMEMQEYKQYHISKVETKISKSFFIELIAALLIGLFIYAIMPLLESYLETINGRNGIFYGSVATIGRVLVSYLFIGCLLILIALRWPYLAFQIAVTLTFCHCMIDLVTDDHLFPDYSLLYCFFTAIIVPSFVVSLLVAIYQRKQFVLKSMF